MKDFLYLFMANIDIVFNCFSFADLDYPGSGAMCSTSDCKREANDYCGNFSETDPLVESIRFWVSGKRKKHFLNNTWVKIININPIRKLDHHFPKNYTIVIF